jgi:farnesol dehydrogenase
MEVGAQKKKVLVTGATGMTGAALVAKLAAEGHQVLAFSRKKLSFFDEHPNICWAFGDVQDLDGLCESMKNVDEVFHLAAIATHWAPDLRNFYRTNVLGTINVLKAAQVAHVNKVVITTSAGVTGPPDPQHVAPVDENHVRLVKFFNDYEASKAIVHERVQDFVRQGMNVVIVMPTRIWGPGPLDPKNSVAYLFSRYLKGQMVTIPGSGNEIGNFVHVDDVVAGHLLAMRHGKPGERYLIGGENLTMNQLVDGFEQVGERTAKRLHIPFGLISTMGRLEALLSWAFNRHPMSTVSTIKRLRYHCPVSIEKAKYELGYRPDEFLSSLMKTKVWLDDPIQSWPLISNPSHADSWGNRQTEGLMQSPKAEEIS